GDRTTARLLDRFGTARAALTSSPADFQDVAGPTASRLRDATGSETRRAARGAIVVARKKGMGLLGRGLPGYPECLLHLADPPPVIFTLGSLELLERPAVAVVGTRRATGSGRRFAERLGEVLAAHDVPVVSGLALGIDGAAHRGALRGGGSTIAVLGTGVDGCHPPSHRSLQRRISETGLLVSEFPPGEEVRPHHFPRRNRIIAALATAVVVVEAGRRSGALITVDHALDVGREVYAVPGDVETEGAQGVNALLRDGARPLVDPHDLLDDLRVAGRLLREPMERGGGIGSSRSMEGQPIQGAGPLLELLGAGPVSTDDLTQRSRIAPARVMQLLSELELEGRVIRDYAGWRRVPGSPR
ncbi:MAG: DNA-processing protein DprA, partial [Gemmatimonadota bacterium]